MYHNTSKAPVSKASYKQLHVTVLNFQRVALLWGEPYDLFPISKFVHIGIPREYILVSIFQYLKEAYPWKYLQFHCAKKEKQVELGMTEKDWNRMPTSNAVHLYVPNSL